MRGDLMTIQDVLEELAEHIEMAKDEWGIENTIAQATTQLKQLFLEMLPLEMNGKAVDYDAGYNSALADIRRKIMETL